MLFLLVGVRNVDDLDAKGCQYLNNVLADVRWELMPRQSLLKQVQLTIRMQFVAHESLQ